jgi:hypothetical protein
MDVSIAFDIRDLSRRYYRYLQFAPMWLNSTGLKEGEKITNYRKLSDEILNRTYGVGFGTETNRRTGRTEFTVDVTGVTREEMESGFDFARRMIRDNYLSMANLKRLQDLIKQWVAADETITSQRESDWIRDPANSFRHRERDLYIAVVSQFTKAHWTERLSWALHDSVAMEKLDELESFTRAFLLEPATKESPTKAIATALEGPAKDGLKREVFDYLKKHLKNFPEGEVVEGWTRLATEVFEDLRQGPEKTIQEMKDLQAWLFARDRAHVSLMTNRQGYSSLEKMTAAFLMGLPEKRPATKGRDDKKPGVRIGDRLSKRYPGFSAKPPLYLGFVHPEGETASVVFMADAAGIDKIDEATLTESLSGRLFSGSGPHTLYMRTWDAGLAYGNGVSTATGVELQTYYADRVPSLGALMKQVSEVANDRAPIEQPSSIDYVLSQTFGTWEMYSFSSRAAGLSRDLRDGDTPDKVRAYRRAILKLRKKPSLINDLVTKSKKAIAPVLFGLKCEGCDELRTRRRSTFFFFGSPKHLNEAASLVPGGKLHWIWQSDYWLD